MGELTGAFLGAYSRLSSADPREREQANQYLLQIVQAQEAWQVAKALLLSGDSNQRFLGAQLLYNKSQASVFTLPREQLQQIANYAITELQRQCGSAPSKQVLYMLQKTAAVCCMRLQKYESALLHQLFGIMRRSPAMAVACSSILGEIPEEIKKLSNSSLANELKVEFLSRRQELSTILVGILQQSKDSHPQSALECVCNWVELGLPLTDDPQLFQGTLQYYMTSQSCFQKCCETLVEDFKNLSKRQGVSLKEQTLQLTVCERQCLTALIGMLLATADKVLAEKSIRNSFAEMLEEFMQVGYCLLFSLPEETVRGVLDLLISMLSHQDVMTSHYAVRFWTSFYPLLKKCEKRDAALVVEYYRKVYAIAADKCNLKHRPASESSDSSIETQLMEVACTGEQGQMTFKEYRLFFVDLFQTIYKLFVEECGVEAGTHCYFSRVFDILRVGPAQQIATDVEMALFLTKSVNLLGMKQSRVPIAAVLGCLPGLSGTDVQRESLLLVLGCSRQIADSPILLPQLSEYILSSLANPAVSSYAAYAFVSLVECIDKHRMEKMAAYLLQLSSSSVLDTLADQSLVKFIAGQVEFLLEFDSSELQSKHLGQLFGEVARMMESYFIIDSQKRMQNSLLRLSVIVETLDQSYTKSLERVVFPFLHKIICFVEQALSRSSNDTYSQSGPLGLLVKITKSTIKIMGGASPTSALLNVLTGCMKFLSSNLLENHSMMSMLSCVLECQNNRNQLLDQWLHNFCQPFIAFVLKYLQAANKANADLLKSFFVLLQKVVVYSPEVMIGCENRRFVEELCLQAFELSDVHLAKQLLLFIEVYIDSMSNTREVEEFIPRVIAVVFLALPYLNIGSFGILGNLLKVYCRVVFPANLQRCLLNCRWMSNASPEQLRIIAKVLEQSVKTHNPKTVKGVLSLVSSIGKGNPRQEIFQSLKRMYDTWYEQQTASD